jgi:two-component system LytT family sensor kinase
VKRLLIIGYATAAASIGSALVAQRYAPETGFARLLLLHGVPYVVWALLVPAIERVPRRVLPLLLAGWVLVPAHAWFTVRWMNSDRFGERIGIDMLIYIAIAAVVWMRDASRRAARAEADLVRAELQILELRMQPHFLFNTLQSIVVLIKKDPDAAARVTRDLAALLRVALRRRGQTTTLESELELVRQYLDIEQVRFGERLRVAWDIQADVRTCVIPDLLLQPLVENAVRHGVTALAEGGTVTIRARRERRLVLEVLDDGAGLTEADERLGVGGTRARLANLFGDDHVFRIEPRTPRGTVVRVEIPCAA